MSNVKIIATPREVYNTIYETVVYNECMDIRKLTGKLSPDELEVLLNKARRLGHIRAVKNTWKHYNSQFQ